MKLLFHTCCAPCAIGCVESLEADGIVPSLFWYNPNIHPFTEYRSRRDALAAFAEEKKLPVFHEDVYGLRSFIRDTACVGGKDGERGRCAFCYRIRLGKAAVFAVEKGFDAFSTSLLISPYQNHELIKKTGEELAVRYGIMFLYRDFRPFFRNGQSRARAAGYYTQKYCGCIFSEEERYLRKDAAP